MTYEKTFQITLRDLTDGGEPFDLDSIKESLDELLQQVDIELLDIKEIKA